MLHFTVDCSDNRLGLEKLGIVALPLLYCMRCELCWYDFVYEVETDNMISIVEAHRGGITEEWCEEIGVNEFPELRATLVEVPEEVENLFDKLNADKDLTDDEETAIAAFTENYANPEVGGYPIVDVINQIGGRSFLCQRLDDPMCEKCRTRMVFLASLTNDQRRGVKMSYDSVQIVFFLCTGCRRVHVQHSM